jgi:hypothetical protein
LIAVGGLELGAIDEVPCFISKEPDIENEISIRAKRRRGLQDTTTAQQMSEAKLKRTIHMMQSIVLIYACTFGTHLIVPN